MITQLAEYAGYISHKEREEFKEQIKGQLGGESISAMTEVKQVGIKIEELHQLASEFYNYKFPNDDPDIFIFNT